MEIKHSTLLSSLPSVIDRTSATCVPLNLSLVVNRIEMGSLNHTTLQSYRLLLKHNFNEKENVPNHIGSF